MKPPRAWEGKPLSATEANKHGRVSRQGQISGGPGVIVSATSRGTAVGRAPTPPPRRPSPARLIMSQGGGETAVGETAAPLALATITYDDELLDPALSPELAGVLKSGDGLTHTFTQSGLFLTTFKAVLLYNEPEPSVGQPPEVRVKAWLKADETDVWESESYQPMPVRQNLSNLLYQPSGSGSGSGSGAGEPEAIVPYETALHSKVTVFGQALIRLVWTDATPPVLKIKRGASLLAPTLKLMCKVEQIPGVPTDHVAAISLPDVESGVTTLSFIRQ